MKQKALTPESLRKLGEGMREQILATLSPKEILAQVPDDGAVTNQVAGAASVLGPGHALI